MLNKTMQLINNMDHPIVIKAEIYTDVQTALREFFKIQEEMNDCEDWPYHEDAETVESFFDIEKIEGDQVLFSTNIYFKECYNRKSVEYIIWLFNHTLGKHFAFTSVTHKA